MSGDTGLGLYDDFKEWRTPTGPDYQQALQEGLVVLDANFLLDLYRNAPDARARMFDVLRKVPNLWVPHQVVREFWQNRENARKHLVERSAEVLRTLAKVLKETDDAFKAWADTAMLTDEESTRLTEERAAGFAATEHQVRLIQDSEGVEQKRNTNDDAVLAELDRLLQGRVGHQLDQESYDEAVKESKRRKAAQEPPGFRDQSDGDYLLWRQTLSEASQRGLPFVLLVTRDQKDDWLEKVGGEKVGPRRELQRELARDAAGARLLMRRPKEFLDLCEQTFNAEGLPPFGDLGPKLDETEQTDPRAAADDSEEQAGAELWTATAFGELLKRLDEAYPGQAAVLRTAIDNGGSISRAEVYRLINRDSSQTLRAFTRPINRLTQALRDEGVLDELAPDPLKTIYDPSISYVQAAGFEAIPTLALELS